jgi:hypothetical protein
MIAKCYRKIIVANTVSKCLLLVLPWPGSWQEIEDTQVRKKEPQNMKFTFEGTHYTVVA